MRQKNLVAMMCMVTAASFVSAAVITVDDDGPADYTSIQAAINAAVNADTVQVKPGHYYENVDFRGKAITLTSTNPADPAVVSATIIDANHSGIVVSFHSGEGADSVLTGFTITGGHAKYGAGVCCWEACSPTISYCRITNNSNGDIVNAYGGGVYVSKTASPAIDQCMIFSNTAYYDGGGVYSEGSVTITGCQIQSNTASDDGGGVYSSGNLTLIDCTIRSNSGYYGGGIRTTSLSTLTRCEIISNTATYGGGIRSTGPIILTECAVSENAAPYGGGIRSSGSLGMTRCIIRRNTGSYGGGIDASNSVVISNSQFCANVVDQDGGGICLSNGTSTISDTTFVGNVAGDGGGVLADGWDSLMIRHCTFGLNSAEGGFGAGISCYESTNPAVITNNIITDNQGAAGICILYSDSACNYNDLWGNSGGDYGGWAWPGDHDMSVDPCFVLAGHWDDSGTPSDPSDDVWVDGDYHLRPDSLCINAGDPGFSAESGETDIDGDVRIRFGRVDVGADEAGSHPADVNEDGVVDLQDFDVFVTAWLTGPGQAGWDARCDIHLPKDDFVNLFDFTEFSGAWFWQAVWYESPE